MDVLWHKTNEFLDLLSSKMASDEGGAIIEMQSQYYCLTLDTISEIGFGVDLGCLR